MWATTFSRVILRSDGVEALAITGSDATRAAPLTYGGSRLRRWERHNTALDAVGEAAPCASGSLESRVLMTERTLMDVRIALGDIR